MFGIGGLNFSGGRTSLFSDIIVHLPLQFLVFHLRFVSSDGVLWILVSNQSSRFWFFTQFLFSCLHNNSDTISISSLAIIENIVLTFIRLVGWLRSPIIHHECICIVILLFYKSATAAVSQLLYSNKLCILVSWPIMSKKTLYYHRGWYHFFFFFCFCFFWIEY